MPILHRCGFPGCTTPTISTYCYHHERFVRDEREAERVQAAARDERNTRELVALNPTTVPPDLPPAA
jgi:hypothetical protein